MRFEYNSDLTFDERVAFVKKEIQDEYPLINDFDANKVASLDFPMDDKINNDDKFRRYYLLMYVIGKNNPEFSHVFNDTFNLYQKGFKDKKNNNLMVDIINYVIGDRNNFPEFFNA